MIMAAGTQERLAQTERDDMVDLLRRKLTGPGSDDRAAFKFVSDRMTRDPDLAVALFPELVRRTGVGGPG